MTTIACDIIAARVLLAVDDFGSDFLLDTRWAIHLISLDPAMPLAIALVVADYIADYFYDFLSLHLSSPVSVSSNDIHHSCNINISDNR